MAQQPTATGWLRSGRAGRSGSDLLQRAPDREIDELFQAVHAAAQTDAEAQALCALFEPDADRSLAGLNAVASQLGPASRDRFANAVADALVGAMQSSPQRLRCGRGDAVAEGGRRDRGDPARRASSPD